MLETAQRNLSSYQHHCILLSLKMDNWAATWQNQQNDFCAQWCLRSAWASAKSDQSLHYVLNGLLRSQAFFMPTAKTLIRLGGCPDWSESLLGAQVILLVLLCSGSYCKCLKNLDDLQNCCNRTKIWIVWFYLTVMQPKDADRMANGADPEHTTCLPRPTVNHSIFACSLFCDFVIENLFTEI